MVAGSYVGGLAARAIFLMSSKPNFKDRAAYVANTADAVDSLQDWYNGATGLWSTTGWWNAGNALVTLADFANVEPEKAVTGRYNIPWIIENTFVNAQKTIVTAQKAMAADGMVTSSYTFDDSWLDDKIKINPDNEIELPDLDLPNFEKKDVSARGFNSFINEYYDDEGWWALALIHSSDLGAAVQHPKRYLDAAVVIFEDMHKGQSTCGGIYWSKTTKYTNAIANELYLSVAAALANRIPAKKAYYLDIATKQWTWFKNSGMIADNHLITDGLTNDCKNNGLQQWTYNQGVVLGGLVELWKATGNPMYLDDAMSIAQAAIVLKAKDGILWEGCEPNCGDDGAQFKGAFIRGLKYLQTARPNEAVKNFILRNADAIWTKDRNNQNQLGPSWPGPFAPATAGTHSSAMDALVAAVAVR